MCNATIMHFVGDFRQIHFTAMYCLQEIYSIGLCLFLHLTHENRLHFNPNFISILNRKTMDWYMKNRWWIWTVTGVYLAYRIFVGIYYMPE